MALYAEERFFADTGITYWGALHGAERTVVQIPNGSWGLEEVVQVIKQSDLSGRESAHNRSGTRAGPLDAHLRHCYSTVQQNMCYSGYSGTWMFQ